MTPRKILFVSIFFTYQVNAETYIPYSTRLHPKAAGVEISITHPASWLREESKAPHTVQKFVKLYPDHKATMMIQVIRVPPNQIDPMRRMDLDSYMKMLNDFGKVIQYNKIKVSNLNGFVGDVVTYDRSGPINSVQQIRIINVLFQDKLVAFWCGVTASETMTIDDLNKKFTHVEPDCIRFINSIKFQ